MWRRGSRRGGREEEECSGLRDGRWKGRGRSLEWNGRQCDGERRKEGGIKREKATSRENLLCCGRRAARSPAATSGHLWPPLATKAFVEKAAPASTHSHLSDIFSGKTHFFLSSFLFFSFLKPQTLTNGSLRAETLRHSVLFQY